jgi:hypothetical protein
MKTHYASLIAILVTCTVAKADFYYKNNASIAESVNYYKSVQVYSGDKTTTTTHWWDYFGVLWEVVDPYDRSTWGNLGNDNYTISAIMSVNYDNGTTSTSGSVMSESVQPGAEVIYLDSFAYRNDSADSRTENASTTDPYHPDCPPGLFSEGVLNECDEIKVEITGAYDWTLYSAWTP